MIHKTDKQTFSYKAHICGPFSSYIATQMLHKKSYKKINKKVMICI